jgi:2-keto-4-pentenoate hydratase
MNADNTITAMARLLIDARSSGRQRPACALADAASAYAVQEAVAHSFGWFPDGLAGYWKSGGASAQSVRTHAPLPPEGILRHPGDARAHAFHMRGIEAEIALRLRVPVDPHCAARLDEVTACTLVDSICVAIEIVDSRWIEGMQAPAWARLADLQSHGALVLGDWVGFERRDWSRQVCTVESTGMPQALRFQGTHALARPTAVLPDWLRHATRGGATVQAGTVVTTGTWCGLLQAAPGDRIRVAFEGIGFAEVRV